MMHMGALATHQIGVRSISPTASEAFCHVSGMLHSDKHWAVQPQNGRFILTRLLHFAQLPDALVLHMIADWA